MNKATFLLFVIIASCLSACQTAPPKTGSVAGSGKSGTDSATLQASSPSFQKGGMLGVKLMTFEELTDCANAVIVLDKGAEGLLLQNTKLDQRKEQLANQNAAIELEGDKLNGKDTSKLHDFNQRVAQLHAANVKLNQDIDQFNAAVLVQEARNQQHDLSCGNRTYLQSDEQRLPQELRTALALHSKSSGMSVQEYGASE